jgi:hypothetical protein
MTSLSTPNPTKEISANYEKVKLVVSGYSNLRSQTDLNDIVSLARRHYPTSTTKETRVTHDCVTHEILCKSQPSKEMEKPQYLVCLEIQVLHPSTFAGIEEWVS